MSLRLHRSFLLIPLHPFRFLHLLTRQMLHFHSPVPHHSLRQIYQRQSRSLLHSDLQLLGLFRKKREGKRLKVKIKVEYAGFHLYATRPVI